MLFFVVSCWFGVTVTSGRTGSRFVLLELLLFLLFETILAVCASGTAGRLGFLLTVVCNVMS